MRPFLVLFAALLAAGLSGCDRDDAPARGVGAAHAAGAADLAELGYRLGDADAPVVVVEFSDFGCPFCARFALGTFPQLVEEYVDRGLVRWRYVPVRFGFAGGALMGAAAECGGRTAGAAGFWRAHEVLYGNQPALRGPDARDRLLRLLGEAGLDADALAACIDDPETDARLRANNRLAETWMIQATPTFLINGVPLPGALPVEYFRQILDTVLDPTRL